MRKRHPDIIQGFDRIAQSYGILEFLAFGSFLQQARIAHLDKIANAKKILLVGEGNGRFLKALLKRNRDGRVTCIDKSPRMLKLARKRIRKSDRERVRFEQNDFAKNPLPLPKHDALVTHFFLDCFHPRTLDDMLPRLRDSLSAKGIWLLADFVEPSEQGTLSGLQDAATRFLYYFFSRTCGIEARKVSCPEKTLTSLGMRRNRQCSYLGGWITSSIYLKTHY